MLGGGAPQGILIICFLMPGQSVFSETRRASGQGLLWVSARSTSRGGAQKYLTCASELDRLVVQMLRQVRRAEFLLRKEERLGRGENGRSV